MIAAAGAALVPWPCRASADGARTVAVLMQQSEANSEGVRLLGALRQSLAELGWREGMTLNLEVRWANDNEARAKAAAQELVSLSPDVIVAPATSFRPAREATHSIPIVFLLIVDPVGQGVVSSLAHPGGNLTGFTYAEFSIGGKLAELLKEIAPRTARVLVLLDPENAVAAPWWRSIEQPARDLGFEPRQALARTEDEMEAAVHSFAQVPDGSLIVPPQSLFVSHRARLIALAAQEHLPAVYGAAAFSRDGGLLSYASDAVDQFSRAASYVDRILKGAKAGDLPVQQPTKFELVVNLKTAKTLGLAVPQSILARADEVIE